MNILNNKIFRKTFLAKAENQRRLRDYLFGGRRNQQQVSMPLYASHRCEEAR